MDNLILFASPLIALVALGVSIYFGSNTKKRGDRQDNRRDKDRERAEAENRARDMATINVKLDGISGDVRDIKDEMRSVRTDVSRLTERVIVVEQSTRSAHHRLDSLERINQKEE